MAWELAHRSAFISKSDEPTTHKFREGIILFNCGEFFKAHEVWEELWLGAAEPEKTFLQGLIQCAAAFHHHSHGNRNGARSLLSAALQKLEKHPGERYGVNVGTLRNWIREFLNAPPSSPVCVPKPPPQIEPIGKERG